MKSFSLILLFFVSFSSFAMQEKSLAVVAKKSQQCILPPVQKNNEAMVENGQLLANQLKMLRLGGFLPENSEFDEGIKVIQMTPLTNEQVACFYSHLPVIARPIGSTIYYFINETH